MATKIICIHFIDNANGKLIQKEYASYAPRVNDYVRFGGEGNEKYYKVIMVVWVYDEPESRYERVNIGVKRTT